ncbi:MAG: Fic family protein [Deltaproteobacteria bacterium]|nr:Fic family protein [Deltaproteobacteria bacterium]
MAINEAEEAILALLQDQSCAILAAEIEKHLGALASRRTLQKRLRHLVSSGRLLREGGGRSTRYRLPDSVQLEQGSAILTPRAAETDERGSHQIPIAMSPASRDIQAHLKMPPEGRAPVGFDRAFLDNYCPGETYFLSADERAELHQLGKSNMVELAAGTYARKVLDRLLIDLSWSSSRLEGNTYTLLDTRRLLDFSQEAEGKERWEAQMLLNHKDAIEFLVDSAEEINFNRYSILNLHALLASELLPDPAAAGRLRHIGVGIGGSTYLPLGVPQLIEECFDQLLHTASAIDDPFEQAFYAMVYLPYLQPFDDVNKRVSRLAANIPFLLANLCPLSFTDVSQDLYNQAILGVYELRRVDLLRDVFLWAYRRSAERYAAIQQSLGDPDPFRLKHRQRIRELIAEVIRGCMSRQDALNHVARYASEEIDEGEREYFRVVVESELLAIHEGNFARYRVKPSEFRVWADEW